MSRPTTLTQSPPAEEVRLARRQVELSVRAVMVSFAVVVLAAHWSPLPGDPVGWLVTELVLVGGLGVGSAAVAALCAERARRRGRDVGILLLGLSGMLLLHATLRFVATVAIYNGAPA